MKKQQQKAKCNTTSKFANTGVASSSSSSSSLPAAVSDSDGINFNNKENVFTTLDCTVNDNKQHVEV